MLQPPTSPTSLPAPWTDQLATHEAIEEEFPETLSEKLELTLNRAALAGELTWIEANQVGDRLRAFEHHTGGVLTVGAALTQLLDAAVQADLIDATDRADLRLVMERYDWVADNLRWDIYHRLGGKQPRGSEWPPAEIAS